MTFVRTKVSDVIVCKPDVFSDDRGYFMETFRQDELEKFLGYEVKFCQDNESKSSRGVLRGLHYQIAPLAQTKLVRVIEGKVLDVAVDIRKNSPTFGHHVAIELSGENKRQLFIPRGFAHGFIVLSNYCVFSYKVDNYYSAKHDRGIAFDDQSLGIDWKLSSEELVLSSKDKLHPPLLKAEDLFEFGVDYYA